MTTEAAIKLKQFAYIGVAQCGCTLSAIVDNPAHAKEVAKEIRAILKWGHIEYVGIVEARKVLCLENHLKDKCPHPEGCPSRRE